MNEFVLLVLLVLIGAPASPRAESVGGHATSELPAYRGADPSAESVTEQNLFANDRFWPYQVALSTALPASSGNAPLDAGTVGVLIRVEASGLARIDFGRDGMRLLPVAQTDLVDRANRVRHGEIEKLAPNLLLAIGPRLVDSSADTLRPLAFPNVAASSGLLFVFADPESKEFAALVAALAPLRERVNLFTIFLPQSEHSDQVVRDRLRALKWTVPFVYDHLAEAYTESLLAEGATHPVVLLQTRDGRVLHQGSANADGMPALRAAIDRAFPIATVAK